MRFTSLPLLTALLISCSPPGKTIHPEPVEMNAVHSGIFESVIFRKENAAAYSQIFKADEFWTPASGEVDTVENDLISFFDGDDSMAAENHGMPPGTRKFILSNLDKYNGQYVGLVINSQKYVQGNFFIYREKYSDWKDTWIIHSFNSHYWSVLYNYDMKRIESFMYN